MSHGGHGRKTAHSILLHWMGMNDQFHVLVGWVSGLDGVKE